MFGYLFLNFDLLIVKVNDLKKPLKIKYIGGGEQGLDMGGLQKEFFQLCVQKLFDPGMSISC